MISICSFCLSVNHYRPIVISGLNALFICLSFGNTKYISRSILASLLLIPHLYRLYIHDLISTINRSKGLRWTDGMVLERGDSR